jgi:hypothetical protein
MEVNDNATLTPGLRTISAVVAASSARPGSFCSSGSISLTTDFNEMKMVSAISTHFNF